MQHVILNHLHLYLKCQVSLIDLSQSDIQKGYGLYIENDIRYAYSSPRQIGASILVQVTYPRMYIKSLAVNESKTKGFFYMDTDLSI